MNNLLAVAIIVNSALYFVCVFALAVLWRCDIAAVAVVVAIGVTYLSYLAQLGRPHFVGWMLVAFSIALGVSSGVILLLQHFAKF